MNTYLYYDVVPKGMKKAYSYLCDSEIETDALVLIPFGEDNNVIAGKVVDINQYSENEVPYPIEKTKHIIKTLSLQEYKESDGCISPWCDEDNREELIEVRENLKNNNQEMMLCWACEHIDWRDSEYIMSAVSQCLRRCATAGDPSAVYHLAYLYENGVYYEQNIEKAFELYEESARAGEIKSIGKLGLCCYHGWNVERDYKKAFNWFETAALLYDDIVAIYMLGDMYAKGYCVEQNAVYAAKLYTKAYHKADPEEDRSIMPDIWLRLGRAILNGEGIHQDTWAALRLLCDALAGFYRYRKEDPVAEPQIQETKELISKATELLDHEHDTDGIIIT